MLAITMLVVTIEGLEARWTLHVSDTPPVP